MPFAKACQHILGFWNEFQNSCKWFLKYLHFIYARNEHFTTHLVPEDKTGDTDTDCENIQKEAAATFTILNWFKV